MRINADDLRAAKWRGTELHLNPMGEWEAGVHYEDAWAALAEQVNKSAEERATFAEEIAAIVQSYVAGPEVPPPGGAGADSATEDRAVERWRYELTRRVEIAMHRTDQNTEGYAIALSIRNLLRSDRLIDQPSAVLKRVLGCAC